MLIMEFKIYDKANKIMYMNAENINDPKWHFGKLHHNIHCTTCISVGKYDKNNINIYTYDMLKIDDLIFYVSEIENGQAKLIGVNSNIEEKLENFEENQIEVIGSILEVE